MVLSDFADNPFICMLYFYPVTVEKPAIDLWFKRFNSLQLIGYYAWYSMML